MLTPHVLDAVVEAVGPEVPVPAPFLKRRFESEDGILVVSFPREENNELMMRVLNRVGSAVYLLCDGHRSIRQIVSEMTGLLPDQEPRGLAEDVIRTIRTLQCEGLLSRPQAMGLKQDDWSHGTA